MAQEKDNYFVNDYEEDGLLYARIVRAPIPRGIIKTINLPDLPEDVIVFGEGDLLGSSRVSINGTPFSLLADTDVRYEGEPVLVIAGPREDEVSELVAATSILCEPVHPVLTFEGYTDEQVICRKSILQGNPSSVFLKAEKTCESNYHVQSMRIPVNDPIGAFAHWVNERLEVVCSTLWPFEVKRVICEALGLRSDDVTVRAAEVSHSFEKLWYPACLAALSGAVCLATKRPVSLVQTHEEGILYAPKSAPVYVHVKTAMDAQGKLIASDIDIAVDVGASCVTAEELLNRIIMAASGCYICTDARVQGKLIMTNKPPMDGSRGLGSMQGFFASEIHAARIAREIDLDPLQFRQNNIIFKAKGKLLTGILPKSGANLPELLNRVAAASDFHRKYAAYELLKKHRKGLSSVYAPVRGIGIACAYQGSGLFGNAENSAHPSVTVRLEKDGRLGIFSSWIPTGPGTLDTWIGIAQEILNIEKKNIVIERPDTSRSADCGPSIFSRNITIVTRLLEQCMKSIQKRRFRSPLPIEETRSFQRIGSEQWDDEDYSGYPFLGMSWGACVTEVEFDPVTLETRVRGIWVAIDCGKILREEDARRSVETEVISALTLTSTRTVLSESGQKRRRKYLPGGEPLSPPISIEFLESERGVPGGIDELPHNLVPASYADALSQACGIIFNSCPLTPAAIQRSLEVL
jgi:CO/xanthine dehydrogenase Mo-binding subunit